MYAQARSGSGTARHQLRFDGIAQPHQDDVDVRIGFQEIERRRHGNVRTMIAAHAINGYGDFHEAWCEASLLRSMGGPIPALSGHSRQAELYSLLALTTFLPR